MVAHILDDLKKEVESANEIAVERMMQSAPFWTDINLAKRLIPNMKDAMLLHAGPPVEWKDMSGPLRGAIIGACLYESWAKTKEEAERLASSGEIEFDSCHNHQSVGPMAGVISPSMPVYEVTDTKYGAKSFSNLNEGLGKVLRYGAFDQETIQKLNWMKGTMMPVLSQALRDLKKERGGLDFKSLIAQAITMGDECHNRYNATTALFVRELAPYLVKCDFDKEEVAQTLRFIRDNNFTTLNLGMASAKAMTMAAHGIKYSTIVTTMARNGTETGIRVSGLGDSWFTARAPSVSGVYFPGFGREDANPDIGDSAITETAGFGGFAMAAAPAIISWVGARSASVATEMTQRMYQITFAEHRYFSIPSLDFRGTPTGIDIRKVVKTGITPNINTGIAHKQAGVGQIGAGLVVLPMDLFKKALRAFASRYLN